MATVRPGSFYLSLLPITILCFLISCNPRTNEEEHSVYMGRVEVSANILNDQGLRDQAIRFLDSAYRSCPGKNRMDLMRWYRVKANFYMYPPADLSRATQIIDSSLSIMKDDSISYKQEYMEALLAKATYLMKENDYGNAVQYFYRGKLFAKNNLDDCYSAIAAGNMAAVTYNQRRYAEAVVYLREQLGQIERCQKGNPSALMKIQSTYDNIALSFDHLNLPDSAIYYYQEALNAIQEYEKKVTGVTNDTKESRAIVSGNLGSAYEKKGDLYQAERLFNESIAINTDLGFNNGDVLLTRVKLARLYVNEAKFKQALQGLQYERHSLDSFPDEDREMKWQQLAWNYFDATGDKETAYQHYLLYNKLKDSFSSRQNYIPPYDLNKAFSHISQEHQIADLQNDYKYTRVSLFIALSFVIMAIIIAYLVWKNYQSSRQNVLKLLQLNQQINEQNVTLQKTLQALQQSQHDNTRIMKMVAHDLQNPVAAMVSLSDIISTEEDRNEQVALADMLKQSGLAAIRLIRNILQTSPILEAEPIQLDDLLAQCVGLLRFKAKEKRQNINLHSVPLRITADREKIWRVFNNLLVNAIKFSFENSDIWVTMENKGSVALIQVKDEGVGIPEGLKGEIFRNLTVAGTTGTAGEQSNGLGLSIVKQLVEAHRGKIWFESAPGKGTTFFVELPTIDASQT